MRNDFSLVIIFAVALISAACSGTPNNSANTTATGGAESPTEAYKQLYAAVKSKNTEAIKAQMTKRTLSFAEAAAARQNVPVEKVLENGFTATTFADSLPEIRDERIDGNMGAVEVRNDKDNRWEDLPFINEDGGWKLAVGELFGGTYKSPGPGRDAKEKAAANSALGNAAMKPDPRVLNANTSGNFKSGNAVRPAENKNP